MEKPSSEFIRGVLRGAGLEATPQAIEAALTAWTTPAESKPLDLEKVIAAALSVLGLPEKVSGQPNNSEQKA